jgi:PAS domain S-box-containing protein
MVMYAEKTRRSGGPQKSLRPTFALANELTPELLPTLIVGIGASAGGIEALSRFFDAMPSDSGAAFVVVLHLDPTRESQMAHILSSHTNMAVDQVANGMRIAPNHIYVIAPDKDLTVLDGGLRLIEPAESRGHRHPVDVLFRSIAADQGERAIAIIMSGTGSNGSDGLKEVKAAGGLIFVQDPSTAKFNGMPLSAIATGFADHILAPEAMPKALVSYLRQKYIAAPHDGETAASFAQPIIDKIIMLLLTRTGHDFCHYRRTTLQRRIQRRLGLRNMVSLDEYLSELGSSATEAHLLVHDLLINVTSFFRDAEAWKDLADLVIAPLVAARDTGATIRAWVPGCSTGEEAYTLAMLISEQAAIVGKKFNVKIFATDAREDNLKTARDGIYPPAAVSGLSSARQRKFFGKLENSYQVKKELRNMCVFAPQDLLRDPPFSLLDLVSCRNLLIYLEPDEQQHVIALFHYSLEPGGFLLLGNTETVGRHEAMFEIISKKWRIYRRTGPTRLDIVKFPALRGSTQPQKILEGAVQLPNGYLLRIADMAREALLERFAPAAVLIDSSCRVVYIHGSTGNYLVKPTGQPSQNLFAMIRDGLATKLRSAVRAAIAHNRNVNVIVKIKQNNAISTVAITVAPLSKGPQSGAYLLVSFTPGPSAATHPRNTTKVGLAGDSALQDELSAVRSELRNSIEHLEIANGELKKSNEVVTSMNEELQSANEELETSKEEMQSFNEELHTVNSQLQHKVHELENSTNDLNNLLTGTETVTLFVDVNLCIKWFTPGTRELFDLMSTDIGRPLAHFARKFDDKNLLSDADNVLRQLVAMEAEVPSAAGRWYLRRMLPYRTIDDRVLGVVITFIDVTDRKRASDASEEARIYAQAIVETIRQPLLVLDDIQRVVSVNRAFEILFQVSAAECHGKLIYQLGYGTWNFSKLRVLLDEVLSDNQQFSDVEVEHDFRDIGHRCLLINGRKLIREGGRAGLILLAIEDISERKNVDNVLRESEAKLFSLIKALPVAVFTTDANGRVTFFNPAAADLWGRTPELGVEVGCGSWKLLREDGIPLQRQQSPMVVALRENRAIRGVETWTERPNGMRVPSLAYPTPLHDESGVLVGGVNVLLDITERKRSEEVRRKLAAIVESSEDAIMSMDLDGMLTSWNPGAVRLFGYSVEDVINKFFGMLVPTEQHDGRPGFLDRFEEGGDTEHSETEWQRQDKSNVWISWIISPLRSDTGKLLGAACIARDITERKRAEDHREILVRELNHRVKNTLAIVTAIASQTHVNSTSPATFRQSFESRLLALARAHDLLIHGNWSGSDLESVVRTTIDPHIGQVNRFRIEGPLIALNPASALTFSLAVHELCTNAVKYGALSKPDGHVAISWRSTDNGEGRHLQLRWVEEGGPLVGVPTRKGFGSSLIEKALARELAGVVQLLYEPSGVVCTIDAPMPLGQWE